MTHRAENVSMVLKENVDEFEIYLGEDFTGYGWRLAKSQRRKK